MCSCKNKTLIKDTWLIIIEFSSKKKTTVFQIFHKLMMSVRCQYLKHFHSTKDCKKHQKHIYGKIKADKTLIILLVWLVKYSIVYMYV